MSERVDMALADAQKYDSHCSKQSYEAMRARLNIGRLKDALRIAEGDVEEAEYKLEEAKQRLRWIQEAEAWAFGERHYE